MPPNTHTVGHGKLRRADKGGKEMTDRKHAIGVPLNAKRRRTLLMWTFAAREVTKTQCESA
jgi:hypothetical protein